MTVARVPAEVVRPLRTAVLRPAFPPGRLEVYDRDETPGTVHVAALVGGAVAGIATAFPEPPPASLRGEIPEAAYALAASWQLRGMATSAEARGTGAGAAALADVLVAAREAGATHVWCNAREGAAGFYTRHGWNAAGPWFEVRLIGPHVVMWRGT